MELPRAKDAPAIARHAVRRLCADRLGDERLRRDAELMVGELVSNAVRHGEGQIRLLAEVDADRLLVEVIDHGSGFERELRHKDLEHIGGWGLDIVDKASSRWGVHEGTTHVWFELERRGPRLDPPPDRDSEG